ncbi:MAG: polyphosphate polymerase domain-containing protein [Bacteroidota bacterium]|nr:polyphosphate polymerase domain-containing protein [Bacteroidota bacterium]
MTPETENILGSFVPIGLEEMDNVRLMDRIDTKYLFSANKVPDLLRLMTEDYRILEINGHRIFDYETIYLDTPDYLFYNQHMTGRIDRNKVRYRKYNSTGITYLEVKKKTKKNRTIKWRIKNILSDRICDEEAREFLEKHLPFTADILKPVISNKFRRITLVGANIRERITLDIDLSFSDTSGHKAVIPNVAIAELKSGDAAIKSPFSAIAKSLSIYPSGFSKYCTGTAILYDLPRKNSIKPTLLLINKIENESTRSLSA